MFLLLPFPLFFLLFALGPLCEVFEDVVLLGVFWTEEFLGVAVVDFVLSEGGDFDFVGVLALFLSVDVEVVVLCLFQFDFDVFGLRELGFMFGLFLFFLFVGGVGIVEGFGVHAWLLALEAVFMRSWLSDAVVVVLLLGVGRPYAEFEVARAHFASYVVLGFIGASNS
jgi:hypothetical protein